MSAVCVSVAFRTSFLNKKKLRIHVWFLDFWKNHSENHIPKQQKKSDKFFTNSNNFFSGKSFHSI
jgi:glycerol kinase